MFDLEAVRFVAFGFGVVSTGLVFAVVAFSIIGAGSDSFNHQVKALDMIMLDEFESIESEARTIVVKYKRAERRA